MFDDPSEKAGDLMQELQDKLDELDRNFRVTITMSFGVPYIAHTEVKLEEEG